MFIQTLLHESAAVLHAAQQHETELAEVGVSTDELYRFRSLIVQVALDQYTQRKIGKPIQETLDELQIVKDLIVRTAELRFGDNNSILQEFRVSF
ncbi:MAG TPA: hypothetical protein VMU30_01950 [Bacteroidota bacterium]|nr:hypothetical protein [Bacteroidota bacterium]